MNFSQFLTPLLGDAIHLSVFSVLASQPHGLTGRGLGKLVGTSPFKINQVLRFLTSYGVVTETVIGRAHQYRLNLNHILVSDLILPLLSFEREFLDKLGSEILEKLDPKPLSIILFGSVAKSEENDSSDLDVLVLYEEKNFPVNLTPLQGNLSEEIGNRYGHFISLKIMEISDFLNRAKKKESLIRNIIKDGKRIAGMNLAELLNYGSQTNLDH